MQLMDRKKDFDVGRLSEAKQKDWIMRHIDSLPEGSFSMMIKNLIKRKGVVTSHGFDMFVTAYLYVYYTFDPDLRVTTTPSIDKNDNETHTDFVKFYYRVCDTLKISKPHWSTIRNHLKKL